MNRTRIIIPVFFVILFVFNLALGQEWTLPITVTGEEGAAPNSFTVYIGGGEPVFLPAPPPPPQYLSWTQLYEPDWLSGPYTRMIYSWPPASDTTIWLLMIDPNGNMMPPIARTSVAVWNADSLPAAGIFVIEEYFSGAAVVGDMRFQDSLAVTGTAEQYFNIICTQASVSTEIDVSANMLEFGYIPVGSQAEQGLTIYNTGEGTLALYDIFTSEAVFFTDYDPADSLIAAGDSLELRVTFQPQIERIYEESLFIVSNASNADTLIVGLWGDGGAVPDSVRNLVISVQGGDAILTWDEVNMSVSGYPLTVDCYLIFFEEDYGEEFNFLAYTSATSYIHYGAGQFSPSMFYYVEAYLGEIELLEEMMASSKAKHSP